MRLRVLFAVRRFEDPGVAAVANFLGVSRQLVAYHLAKLEAMGHVLREGTHYRVSVFVDVLRADVRAARTAPMASAAFDRRSAWVP